MTDIPTEKAIADKYAKAVSDLLEQMAVTDGAGSMNAALGALVSVQARFIASIPERRVRRAAIDAVTKMLPKEVARHIDAGAPKANVHTIAMPGRTN